MKRLIVRPDRIPTTTIRCSVTDSQLHMLAPRGGFCFRERLDPERLAHALGRVLPDYYAFAGRLSRRATGMYIEPSSGGVPLDVVESNESFDDLVDLANSTRADGPAGSVPMMQLLRGKGPLFAAKLTLTRDGCVLGWAWHHPAGDYYSLVMLMSAWARAYRGLPHEKGFEPGDRDAYLSQHLPDPPGSTSAIKVMSAADVGRMVVGLSHQSRRVMLEFTDDDLRTIQAALTRDQRINADDALWAQIFMLIRQLRGNPASSQLGLTVDLRKRAGLPLNLLGNIVGFVFETAHPTDDAAKVAAGMRAQVQQYAANSINHHATLRYVAAHARPWQRKLYMPVGFDPYRGNFLVSNIVRFTYDSLEFEPTAPVVRYFCKSGESFWSGMVFEPPPAQRPGQPTRVLTMWLPEKIARRLGGEEGRARVLAAAKQSARTTHAAAVI